MITFNRSIVNGQYQWLDADGNRLQVNLTVFNTIKLKSTYQGNDVLLKASVIPPVQAVNQLDPVAAPQGLFFELIMTSYPIFDANAMSIEISDTEFVRAARAGALRLVSDDLLFVG